VAIRRQEKMMCILFTPQVVAVLRQGMTLLAEPEIVNSERRGTMQQ